MTTRTLHCAPGVPTVYRQVVPQYQPVQTAVQQPGVAIVYGQATPQYQYQPVQATVPGQQPVPIVYGQATPQGYHPVPVIVTQQPAAVARQEQWYSDGLFGRNYNIAQPDPGRMVLSGSRSRYGFVRYTYADQLPCLISCFITCAAIMVILGTPLSLICSIPAVIQLKKVSRLIAGIKNETSCSDM